MCTCQTGLSYLSEKELIPFVILEINKGVAFETFTLADSWVVK